MTHQKITDKNFLKLISEYLPDMLWAKDLQGKYLFANRAICDNLLMSSPEEVVGNGDVFFAKREREKYSHNPHWHTFGELCYNSDEVVLESMQSMQFEEYGNIRGELTYLEVHKAPLYNEAGELIGTIGSGRDITIQKKLESELVAMNALIDSGPVVLFEWSAEEGWPIKNVSQNVEAVLGMSYAKLMDGTVHFSDYIHPDDIESVSAEVAAFISAQTGSFSQQYRIVNTKGGMWIKDFTVIDYDAEGFPVSIKGYLLDNTVEIEAKEKIDKLSFTDQLTGLQNRQKMQLDIQNQKPYGCIVFNIDRFREINDLFGVSIGDSILTQVGAWFKKLGLDVYRIGGDEFATLLFEQVEWSALEFTLAVWLEELSQTYFHIGNELISIRMNIGVALGSQKLLTQADIALHNAKEAKIAYALYEETENVEELYRTNIAMTATIHKAIAKGQIICHYQPIVDFTTGKAVKYETLVRLIDESNSIIPPLYFLPIAKKTKLYSQITRSVVHQACKTFAHREEEFSINLSIDDIEDPTTVQDIINTLLKTETASRVVFEILESEGIENYESVQHFIKQVKSLGAKIAIDDFGTGYSNFEHILQLHVDYIKIDGSLVRNIATDERHAIIVETIVDFARKIGAKTIAEFVSDEAIFLKLKSLGVDYSQGYYTGKPEPI